MPQETTAKRLQRVYETRDLCQVSSSECDSKARGTFAGVLIRFENGSSVRLDITLCPFHAKKFLGADAPR